MSKKNKTAKAKQRIDNLRTANKSHDQAEALLALVRIGNYLNQLERFRCNVYGLEHEGRISFDDDKARSRFKNRLVQEEVTHAAGMSSVFTAMTLLVKEHEEQTNEFSFSMVDQVKPDDWQTTE